MNKYIIIYTDSDEIRDWSTFASSEEQAKENFVTKFSNLENELESGIVIYYVIETSERCA